MSHFDILQLYMNQRFAGNRVGIVISPRQEGIKVLCVSLTKRGFEELESYRYLFSSSKELRTQYPVNSGLGDYMLERIQQSSSKFYAQIPFSLSAEPCTVVDFRSKEEISEHIQYLFTEGNVDTYWL